MVIVMGVVLSGCGPNSMTRRQLEARKESHQRLTFDSATTVLVLMNRSVDEAASIVWTGVLELGGPVETVRGDTLIIEPHYILRRITTLSGEVRVVRFSDMRVLPALVFIPAGSAFHLVPPKAKRRGPSIASMVVFGLVALDLYIRWPRG